MFRRSTLPVLAGLVLAGSPSVAKPPAPKLAPIAPPKLAFEKHVLGNGLTVLLHQDHSSPLAAVHLSYHVGSKNELPGRTGFAHLFEHMMFQGSQHHDDDFFAALEPLGATDLNGTTDHDRTRYFQTVPASALERTLWLEADRMGWLLPSMTDARFENQREVVRNERRQSMDNQPYGTVRERMFRVLYPPGHPYHWDVIGDMDDLQKAPKADVETFFRTWYGPNNCTLVVAGDIDPAKTMALVERYFGSIPPGPPLPRTAAWIPELTAEARLSMEDRVPLPRLYLAWHAPPAWTSGEAELDVLAGVLVSGKTSRLYKRLVYELQIAQDVSAYDEGREIGGLFWVVVTARPDRSLDEIAPLVDEELARLRASAPRPEEVERVRTGILAGFVRGVEKVGGKADRLALYATFTGDPGWIGADFERYRKVTPQSVQAAARRWLHEGRVVMRVNPFPQPAAAKEPDDLDRAKTPAVPAPAAARIPAPVRAKLSNGMPVLLVKSDKVPVVHLSLVLGGGWSADTAMQPPKPGTASFTARMMDEGTKTRSALQISEEAQLLGAHVSAGSSLDTLSVGLNALKDRLAPALDLWSEVVLSPSFPADELERQRALVLGQILQEKKRPRALGLRLLPALLYGEGHPYAQPLTGSGTEESVRALTREDLVRFHARWVQPSNATLVVVGDADESIVPMLEARLGAARWKASESPVVTVPERAPPAATQAYLVDKPGAAQSVLLAAQLLPPRRDPRRIPFEVLDATLGSQFTSRLNMKLREEKSWTYGAYAYPVDTRGTDMLLAFSEVRTDATSDALAELQRQFRDLREKRPPTADEISRAADNLVLSLPGQYDTAGGIASKLVESVAFGLADDYWERYPDRVRAETTASQAAVARDLLQPDRMVVVVVGDRAAVEPGLRKLFPTLRFLDADGKPVAPQ